MQTKEEAKNAALCRIRAATQGERNNITSKESYFLGGLIPHGEDQQELENKIVEASTLPRYEAINAAQSGLMQGSLKPLNLGGSYTPTSLTKEQQERIEAKAKAAQEKEQHRIEQKQRWAVSLWDKGQSIPDWVGYLPITRALLGCDFAVNIRYLPSLKYRQQGELVSYWPALILAARPEPTATVQSSFRLYLSQDGSEKAPIAKPKLASASFKGLGHWLGNFGSDTLIICEGVENAYSLQLMRNDKPLICAAFSSGNMSNIMPPDGITTVILAGDNDRAGQAANKKAGSRLYRRGYHVKTLTIKDEAPTKGMDWNDLLLSQINGGVNL